MMNFDQAFTALLKHEGGFSDHAADPGGKTRFGITRRRKAATRKARVMAKRTTTCTRPWP